MIRFISVFALASLSHAATSAQDSDAFWDGEGEVSQETISEAEATVLKNDEAERRERTRKWNEREEYWRGVRERDSAERRLRYERHEREREAMRRASERRIWEKTGADIRRSVTQSIEMTRPPQTEKYVPTPRSRNSEEGRRTVASGDRNASRSREAVASGSSTVSIETPSDDAVKRLGEMSRSSTNSHSGSSTPSARDTPEPRYWVWSYYCDFYGWPSAHAQSKGPGASKPGFAAMRPMVVSRERGHDWMAELDRLERKSRREIEHRVVQSSIRLATDLEDFSCGGGLSNPYDTQSLANDMARSEQASQDANAQSAEGGSELFRFNPFN